MPPGGLARPCCRWRWPRLLQKSLTHAAPKTLAESIVEKRKRLDDGNPAEGFEAKSEVLWETAHAPAQATLQCCDLGLGPGVVKGAWLQLLRWFADSRRAQGLASRLSTCIETLLYTWGKLCNSKASFTCANLARFGHAKLLDAAQFRHLGALLLDPKSPVNP